MISNKSNELEKILYLFNTREFYDSYHTFGNKKEAEVVRFTVWAPNAKEVAVVGAFNV